MKRLDLCAASIKLTSLLALMLITVVLDWRNRPHLQYKYIIGSFLTMFDISCGTWVAVLITCTSQASDLN